MNENTKTNVLIAEADRLYAAELKKNLEEHCSSFNCTLCHAGDTVKQCAEANGCEILIISLMLPVLDGIAVLDQLCREETNLKLIVMLSPIGSDALVKSAISRGADYYMVTPVDPREFAKKILYLYDMVLYGAASPGEYPVADTSCTSGDSSASVRDAIKKDALLIPEYRKRIRRVLSVVGIPAKVKGFKYLEEAVVMALEDRCCVNNITKIVYPVIARRFDASPATVERGIRTAIDIAWNRPDAQEHMQNFFSFAPMSLAKKPTNAELIAMLADKITVDGE